MLYLPQSYCSGIARSQDTSAYPDLWEGLLHGWDPSAQQGETGYVYDLVGQGEQSLRNSVGGVFVSSNWTTIEGGSAVPVYNGTNQADKTLANVDLSAVHKLTIVFDLYWDAYANDDDTLMESSTNYNSFAGAIRLAPNPSSPTGVFVASVSSGASKYATVSFPRATAAEWHSYMLNIDFTQTTVFSVWTQVCVDGVIQTLTSVTNTLTAAPGNAGSYPWCFMSRNTTSLFGAGKLGKVLLYDGERQLLTVDKAERFTQGESPFVRRAIPSVKLIAFAPPAGSNKTAADAPSTSDAATRALVLARTTDDATSTSDTVAGSRSHARTASATPSTSDSATWTQALGRVITGAPTTSDTATRVTPPVNRTAVDAPTTSDTINATRGASLADKVVGHWRLDEAAGATAVDDIGTNNLTVNATVGTAAGKIGTARSFGGGTTVNTNSLKSGSSPAGLSFGDQPFTIQAWVNTTSLSGTFPGILGKGTNANTNFEYSLFLNSTGTPRFAVTASGNATTNYSFVTSGIGNLATGTWYHIVAKHDPVANIIGIKVNDGAWATTAHTAGVLAGTNPLNVGCTDQLSGTRRWNGVIDEVAIFDEVLTDAEITRLYNGGAGLAIEDYGPHVTGPVATIASPTASASVWNTLTVTGAATSDTGTVTSVEVSTDGTTWNTATGTTSWTYALPAQTSGLLTIYARANDDSPDTGDAATVSVTMYAFGATTVAENAQAAGSSALSTQLFTGMGTQSTQGFARGFSFVRGDTIQFPGIVGGAQVKFQLFRLGYYGGTLIRSLGTITGTPITQPIPAEDANTRSQNCNAWTSIASWTVPSDARPGMYMAKMYRTDVTSEGCNILFCVRSEGFHDIGYITADFTWHLAYGSWGTSNSRNSGRSLYGTNDTFNGDTSRAARVYYDRPTSVRGAAAGQLTRFWRNEMAAIAFLERNGYDVGYTTCKDTSEANGATILGYFPTLFMAGHNEYWSQEMFDRITARVNAGMNLFHMSGNTCFWRVLYDQTNRYIECWKESENASAKIGSGGGDGQAWGVQPTDSSPPSLWTGTWRDNNALATNTPENALLGTAFIQNNDGNRDISFARPRFAGHRAWANTQVAAGFGTQTFTSAHGFEVDTYKMPSGQSIEAALVTSINAARPAGTILLSYQSVTTTQMLKDDGDGYGSGTYDYGFTLRKTVGGGIVFSTGSMNTSWCLYNFSDGDVGDVTSTDFKQMTVNVLAEMAVQPFSIEGTLTAAVISGDSTGPTADITSHTGTEYVGLGNTSPTISGIATTTGGTVAGIEWSLDGTTWTAIDPTDPTSWSFTATLVNNASNTLRVRGVDDWGNVGTADTVVLITQAAGATVRSFSDGPNTSDAAVRVDVITRTATAAPSTLDATVQVYSPFRVLTDLTFTTTNMVRSGTFLRSLLDSVITTDLASTGGGVAVVVPPVRRLILDFIHQRTVGLNFVHHRTTTLTD